MSTKLPTRPAQMVFASTPRFAIVASEYNPDFVQALVNNTCKELYAIEENCVIELFGVPGSFEIPVTAEMIAAQRRHDVIIALGVILQGKTKHADLIASSVSDGLQQVALKHSVPVIHEVLLVASEEEARERCSGEDLNRGIEAARAAFTMLRVREVVQKKKAAR
ncbi:MAG: 6,7-dimethyl-8-ribityllumazine synthase [Chthoniobacterales bacterium]|jgi:6,7-dimethyl-8-ribityllumazine synthase